MMTNPINPIIADRQTPPDTPSPFSRDQEIERLQWAVGILTKRQNELLDRMAALEKQQVAVLMAGRRGRVE